MTNQDCLLTELMILLEYYCNYLLLIASSFLQFMIDHKPVTFLVKKGKLEIGHLKFTQSIKIE